MSTPRENEAQEYLEKHEIHALLDDLTSLLFFHRPDRPKEFLIDQLEKIKVSKVRPGNTSCLFNESDMEALFAVLDPAKQGFITCAQYREALKTLGIKNFNEFPDGSSDDRISQETFIKEVTERLL